MAGQELLAGPGPLGPKTVSLQAVAHVLEQEGPWQWLPQQVGKGC